MTKIFVILLSLYTTNVFAGYGGYIGANDNRSYGSLSDPDYQGVVKLYIGKSRCTGGFISKNLVLTNDHCVLKCVQGNQCTAEFWNGSAYEKSNLKVAAYYKEDDFEVLNGKDWGILVSDKDSNFYRPISQNTTPGQVLRGGFGTLRIIEDSEIPFLRELYAKTWKEVQSECGNKGPECVNRHVEEKLKRMGKKPLLGDTNNFKIQTCNILGPHPKSDRMVKTDCDSAGGDSGAPLLRSGQIVALNNSGQQFIFGEADANANAVKTENFYKYAQKYIAKHVNSSSAHSSQPNNNNNTNQGTNSGVNSMPGNLQPSTNQPNSDDEQQRIEQILQQRLQEFDCD